MKTFHDGQKLITILETEEDKQKVINWCRMKYDAIVKAFENKISNKNEE